MSISPATISADGTGSFQAIAQPVGSVIPAGIIPAWTSSDVTIATIAADASGLDAVLTGVASGSVTLTVAATLASGKIAQGSLVVSVTPGTVQSFTIIQTA